MQTEDTTAASTPVRRSGNEESKASENPLKMYTRQQRTGLVEKDDGGWKYYLPDTVVSTFAGRHLPHLSQAGVQRLVDEVDEVIKRRPLTTEEKARRKAKYDASRIKRLTAKWTNDIDVGTQAIWSDGHTQTFENTNNHLSSFMDNLQQRGNITSWGTLKENGAYVYKLPGDDVTIHSNFSKLRKNVKGTPSYYTWQWGFLNAQNKYMNKLLLYNTKYTDFNLDETIYKASKNKIKNEVKKAMIPDQVFTARDTAVRANLQTKQNQRADLRKAIKSSLGL